MEAHELSRGAAYVTEGWGGKLSAVVWRAAGVRCVTAPVAGRCVTAPEAPEAPAAP